MILAWISLKTLEIYKDQTGSRMKVLISECQVLLYQYTQSKKKEFLLYCYNPFCSGYKYRL